MRIRRAWFRRTSPWQWLKRRQGIAKLRVRLDVNPHDRDARFQLAELLVEREENDEALSLLEKNVDAGDSDVETLWLAGKAAFASSRADARELGERYLKNGEVDLRRKLFIGDLWCRLVMHFPTVADRWEDQIFLVEDTESGARFGVAPRFVAYYPVGASGSRATAWTQSVLAFESLLESEDVADCEATVVEQGMTQNVGVRDGRAFQVVRY